VRDVEEVDVLLDNVSCRHSSSSCTAIGHTFRSSHFSFSVIHLVSPSDSSIRYSSGSAIVSCDSCKTTWSFGCDAAAARAAVYSGRNSVVDFMFAEDVTQNCGEVCSCCRKAAGLTR
jgi:hypothetical protein